MHDEKRKLLIFLVLCFWLTGCSNEESFFREGPSSEASKEVTTKYDDKYELCGEWVGTVSTGMFLNMSIHMIGENTYEAEVVSCGEHWNVELEERTPGKLKLKVDFEVKEPL